MTELREFECHALRLLVSPELGADPVQTIISEGELVSYRYTGCGYFLTIKHSSLPSRRIVCHKPIVVGHSVNIQCGFIAFIENGRLTLECHTWGDAEVPENFRDQNIDVSEA